MVLRDYKEQGDWLYTAWQLTYKMGWKGVLYVSEAMYPYLEHGEVLANDMNVTEKVSGQDKKFMSLLEDEKSSLTVRGMSKILKCPLQMTLYNQTYVCEALLPLGFFKDFASSDNQYRLIAEQLGQLLNSAEILGHVWLSKSCEGEA